MARVDVIMPQMGESIAEGTLSKWLKKVGDDVKRDEPIFEISTDKVDAEIPAPSAGVIAEIIVTEGQTVAVQTVVARIETEAGAAVAAAPPASGPPASAPAAAPASPAATSAGPPPRQQSVVAAPSPANQIAAASTGIAPSGVGSGRQGSGGNGSREAGGAASLEERVRTKSSPLVRKIAAEHGIELGAMQGQGSGVAGRVTKKDILQFIESGAPAVAAASPSVEDYSTAAASRATSIAAGGVVATPGPSMHAPGGVDHHGQPPEPFPGDVVEPMSKMRALIADHMVASRRTSAHVTSFMEVDLTRIARIRAKHRAQFEQASGQKLTYLPFIIKATVDGLKQFPVMNASVAGTSVIYRKQYNIGIAVALDWGLIVPVIKHADDLSLTGLTRSLNDLANRARVKKLNPAEVQDGTFTITNPGVFGSLMGTPIINQPQVAIMGVGAIEKRPKVIAGPDGEDTIAIRTCAFFSISFDHRVIDGAVADQFLAYVKKQLESFPETGL